MFLLANQKEILNKKDKSHNLYIYFEHFKKDLSKNQVNHIIFFWDYILVYYICKF